MKMKKILVCEDDETLIKVIKFLFKKDNVEVESVTNGNDAVPAAKKEAPSLILLDVMLPGKDGLTILKELKSDKTLSLIPVIMTSGVEKKNSIDKAFEFGIIDYIIKPFVPAELHKKLLSYL